MGKEFNSGIKIDDYIFDLKIDDHSEIETLKNDFTYYECSDIINVLLLDQMVYHLSTKLNIRQHIS